AGTRRASLARTAAVDAGLEPVLRSERVLHAVAARRARDAARAAAVDAGLVAVLHHVGAGRAGRATSEPDVVEVLVAGVGLELHPVVARGEVELLRPVVGPVLPAARRVDRNGGDLLPVDADTELCRVGGARGAVVHGVARLDVVVVVRRNG